MLVSFPKFLIKQRHDGSFGRESEAMDNELGQVQVLVRELTKQQVF